MTDGHTTEADDEVTAPPAAGRRRRPEAARWLAFPALVLLAMLVLVALNLNGSSIGKLSVTTPAPGLVAGTPRDVRVDEWFLQTPIAISSVRQDYPRDPWIGLSRIDQAATAHGGPTHDWSTIFKPQDYGYLFGAARGLAWTWWWSFAVGLLGCYALIGMLTRRPLLSALLAAAAVFTPYAGWWTAPPPALFVGYAAAVAAFMMAAWTLQRRRYAIACAIGSGFSGVALVLALYPPWIVTLGYVIVAAGVGFAIDRRVGWRRFFWPIGVAAVSGGVFLGAWYVQHRDTIATQLGTYYPGNRVSAAGTGSLRQLLDGPLNFWMAGDAGQTLGKVGDPLPPSNQSEAASSWLPLPVMALLVLGVLELLFLGARGYRSRHGRSATAATAAAPSTGQTGETTTEEAVVARPPIWTLALTSAAIVLLLAWTLLDLPSFVGKITQLQQVEPTRTPLALGLAAILLVAAATTVPSSRRPYSWSWPAGVIGVVLTVLATLYADRRLAWNDKLTPAALVALSGLLVAVGFAGLVVRRLRLPAAILLAAYTAVSWATINPLQHGIAPVTKDALVKRLVEVTRGSDNPRVEVFVARNVYVEVARVRAAGLQSLTGTTLYPDADLMTALAPTQERLWNNYAQYTWISAPTGTPPTIKQVNGTQMSLTISACDPVLLAKTDPGWVVSDAEQTASCLSPVSTLKRAGLPTLWIYRVR